MKLAGTQLKELLEKVNITPETYRAMKANLHLEPTCNCDMWVDILDLTHDAWLSGGWKRARKVYNERREYYARPR